MTRHRRICTGWPLCVRSTEWRVNHVSSPTLCLMHLSQRPILTLSWMWQDTCHNNSCSFLTSASVHVVHISYCFIVLDVAKTKKEVGATVVDSIWPLVYELLLLVNIFNDCTIAEEDFKLVNFKGKNKEIKQQTCKFKSEYTVLDVTWSLAVRLHIFCYTSL